MERERERARLVGQYNHPPGTPTRSLSPTRRLVRQTLPPVFVFLSCDSHRRYRDSARCGSSALSLSLFLSVLSFRRSGWHTHTAAALQQSLLISFSIHPPVFSSRTKLATSFLLHSFETTSSKKKAFNVSHTHVVSSWAGKITSTSSSWLRVSSTTPQSSASMDHYGPNLLPSM